MIMVWLILKRSFQKDWNDKNSTICWRCAAIAVAFLIMAIVNDFVFNECHTLLLKYYRYSSKDIFIVGKFDVEQIEKKKKIIQK